MTTTRRQEIRTILLAAYQAPGLWHEANPAYILPDGYERSTDPHLAFLTLTYTLSGGRDPNQLWAAARQTAVSDPDLFNPQFLAYANPKTLIDRLHIHQLTHKPQSETTTWQRIGKALVMRAGGSVQKLLADYHHDSHQLLDMLTHNKTTFPILSGTQTAPRWLNGLAVAGSQPLTGLDKLPIPVTPAITRALNALAIPTDRVSAPTFDPLTALAQHGCHQRPVNDPHCPATPDCPVAAYCQYTG